MVLKLPSYCQDTPHALRDLEEENPRSPQPVHAILVTRHDGGRGGAIQQHPPGPGMHIFREALDSSRFRSQPKLPTDFLMTLMMFFLAMNLLVLDSAFWV